MFSYLWEEVWEYQTRIRLIEVWNDCFMIIFTFRYLGSSPLDAGTVIGTQFRNGVLRGDANEYATIPFEHIPTGSNGSWSIVVQVPELQSILHEGILPEAPSSHGVRQGAELSVPDMSGTFHLQAQPRGSHEASRRGAQVSLCSLPEEILPTRQARRAREEISSFVCDLIKKKNVSVVLTNVLFLLRSEYSFFPSRRKSSSFVNTLNPIERSSLTFHCIFQRHWIRG